MIAIKCPCGLSANTSDANAGKRTKCPECGSVIRVGQPTSDPIPSDTSTTWTPNAIPASDPLTTVEPGRVGGIVGGHPRASWFCLGVVASSVVFGLAWRFQPKSEWERIATEADPSYMVMKFDAGVGSVRHEEINLNTHKILIGMVSEYYNQNRSVIAQQTVLCLAELRKNGIPSDSQEILYGSIKVAEKADKKNGKKPTYGFTVFAQLYEKARKIPLDHNDALERIDGLNLF